MRRLASLAVLGSFAFVAACSGRDASRASDSSEAPSIAELDAGVANSAATSVEASLVAARDLARRPSAKPAGAMHVESATTLWSPSGTLATPRTKHMAVQLPGGQVMVVGGFDQYGQPLASTEIYDWTTHTWTAGPDAPFPTAEGGLFVVPTTPPQVLLVGGNMQGTPMNGSALYEPNTKTWTSITTNPMKDPHAGGILVQLPGGKVLAATGGDPNSLTFWSSAEIFDPATMGWTQVDPVATLRRDAASVVLQDGRVLVIGGMQHLAGQDFSVYFDTTDFFDPATGKWTAGPKMTTARAAHTATVLGDYKIVVAGGQQPIVGPFGPTGVATLASSEIFDPATSSWTAGPTLAIPRYGHTATWLPHTGPSGKLVVIGGHTSTTLSARAEIADFSAASPTWSLLTAGPAGVYGHTATLNAGASIDQLLIAGGHDPMAKDGSTTIFAPEKNGDGCATGGECTSGFCVDGVCCDKACDGACQACSSGTCTAAPDGPDARGLCGDPACVAGCTAGACAFKSATTACGTANCTGSTLTPAAHCEGTKGACVASAPRVCPGNVKCQDATSCRAKCTSDADCADGACDVTTGACGWVPDGGIAPAGDAAPAFDGTPPLLTTSVKHCTQASDCSTGFCVDGVCCDSACTDRCHSCALPSSPGHCALEPIGVDLRNECGPALSCLGTCGADGVCAVAQKGTTCAPSRCTSPSAGLGPAACSAAGAKCPTQDSVPFDCAPYVCESAVGACRITCDTSDDCVNGFVCDMGSHICTTAPPSNGGSSCTYGHGAPSRSGTGAGLVAFVAIAIVAARRRARAVAAAGVVSALAGCGSKGEPASVDAGAPAPSANATVARGSLVKEIGSKSRFASAIAERTKVRTEAASFRFETRATREGRLDARLSSDGRTLTLADASAPDAWIELVARDRDAAAAVVEDDAVVARGANLDVVFVGGRDRVEEIRLARAATPSTLSYAVRRGPNVGSVRVVGDRVEVRDRAGAVRVRSEGAFAVDAKGTTRAMKVALDGDVLAFSLDATGLVAPIAIDPAWTSGATLGTPRYGHTATLLLDGRVLVAGGADATGTLSACELYDPKTQTWAATAALVYARTGHTATLLDDGRVLVAGNQTGAPPELFDPNKGGWITLQLGYLSADTSAVKLADGRVLLAGGHDYMATFDYAYLFDPKNASNPVTQLPALPQPRWGHASALLPNGTPMIVGGSVAGSLAFDANNLMAPWSPLPGFTPSRTGIAAYSTPKGLLVVGAALGDDVPIAFSYDFVAKTWSEAAKPSVQRYSAASTWYVPLTKSTGGRVLVSGGALNDGTTLSSVEIYDPATNTWAPTSSMSSPRRGHTVTQLADGSVLVTGGTSDGTTPIGATDTFSPSALGSPCTASGDCYSGFCTDGVCCSVATCGAGRACTSNGTGCSAAKGTSCTSDTECASGHCANGVCCDTACDGVCVACNLEASKGTCTSLGASCLGEPADASPVTDAGGDGGPPVIHEAFTHCSKASDCASGNCVEGVCCDTPCNEVCHSCALTGSIGKCTLEPVGVDLKHECGPGRSCLGTCGGDGTCVGASTGTQCETSRCTGASTGVGPALCASAGGACQLDQVAPFDCAPYVCEPAFGACRSTCTSSDQCAQGSFCDTSTQTCVTAPPSGGGGGCTYADGGGAGVFALAGAIAALGLVARRRRVA